MNKRNKKRAVNHQTLKHLKSLAKQNLQKRLLSDNNISLIDTIKDTINQVDLKKLGVNDPNWKPSDALDNLQKENISQLIEDVKDNVNPSKLDATQSVKLFYVNVYEGCVNLDSWELIAQDNTITIIKCNKTNDKPVPIEVSSLSFSNVNINQATTLKNISAQILSVFEEATMEIPNLQDSGLGRITLPNKLLFLDFVAEDGTEDDNYLFNDRVFIIQNSTVINPNNFTDDKRLNLTFNSWNMVKIDKNINSIVAKADHVIFQEHAYQNLAIACKGHTLLNYGGCSVSFVKNIDGLNNQIKRPLLFDQFEYPINDAIEIKNNTFNLRVNVTVDWLEYYFNQDFIKVTYPTDKQDFNNFNLFGKKFNKDDRYYYGGILTNFITDNDRSTGIHVNEEGKWKFGIDRIGYWASTYRDEEISKNKNPFTLTLNNDSSSIENIETNFPLNLDFLKPILDRAAYFAINLNLTAFQSITVPESPNTFAIINDTDGTTDINPSNTLFKEGLSIYGNKAEKLTPFWFWIVDVQITDETFIIQAYLDVTKSRDYIDNVQPRKFFAEYFPPTNNIRRTVSIQDTEQQTVSTFDMIIDNSIDGFKNAIIPEFPEEITATFTGKIIKQTNDETKIVITKIIFQESNGGNANPFFFPSNPANNFFSLPVTAETAAHQRLLNELDLIGFFYTVSDVQFYPRPPTNLKPFTFKSSGKVNTNIDFYSIIPINIFYKSANTQTSIAPDIYCYSFHFDTLYNNWADTNNSLESDLFTNYEIWFNTFGDPEEFNRGNLLKVSSFIQNEDLVGFLAIAIYFSYVHNNAYSYNCLDTGKAIWKQNYDANAHTGTNVQLQGIDNILAVEYLPCSVTYAFIETLKQCVATISKPEDALNIWTLRGILNGNNSTRVTNKGVSDGEEYFKPYDGIFNKTNNTILDLTWFNSLNEDLLWSRLPNNGNVNTNGIYSIFSSFISRIKLQPSALRSNQVNNTIPGLKTSDEILHNDFFNYTNYLNNPLFSSVDYTSNATANEESSGNNRIFWDFDDRQTQGLFRIINVTPNPKGGFQPGIKFMPWSNIVFGDSNQGRLVQWKGDSYFYQRMIFYEGDHHLLGTLILLDERKDLSSNVITPKIRVYNKVFLNPSPNPLQDTFENFQKNTFNYGYVNNMYLFPVGNLKMYPTSPYFDKQQLDSYFNFRHVCYYFTFNKKPETEKFKLERLTLRGLFGSSNSSYIFINNNQEVIFNFEDLTSSSIDLFDEHNDTVSLTEFIVLDC